MSVNNVGGPGQVQMMSIEGLDLESMLMAVQTNRVNLLDQQLKDQMGAVQDRNNRINELNVGMNGMNKILAGNGTAATDGVSQPAFGQAGPRVPDTAAIEAATSAVTAADQNVATAQSNFDRASKGFGFSPRTLHSKNPLGFSFLDAKEAAAYALNEAKAQQASATAALAGTKLGVPDPQAAAVRTRADAEAYIKGQQSQIDALGNSQQMDMLRLQSLSGKRNEAFDIMTNFMKKMADSRSGIASKIG